MWEEVEEIEDEKSFEEEMENDIDWKKEYEHWVKAVEAVEVL